MGLAPPSSVPLATAKDSIRGPEFRMVLSGTDQARLAQVALRPQELDKSTRPLGPWRSRGASPLKVLILVCRELVLDSIAPNITNKQQSKWSPSQPLVGFKNLVPGESLFCTALNLMLEGIFLLVSYSPLLVIWDHEKFQTMFSFAKQVQILPNVYSGKGETYL